MGSKKDIGYAGESVACQFLTRKGFVILERNFRRSFGEIDIIVERDNVVHFVEVKSVTCRPANNISRETGKYRPEEMAHERKLSKVARVAQYYMSLTKDERDYQIDVVALELDHSLKRARCRYYEQVL